MRVVSPFMKIFVLAIILTCAAAVSGAVTKNTAKLRLGSADVRVNVYSNPASILTFIAPHYNEQAGLRLAKEFVATRGGRLIEIESFDASGRPSRYIRFTKDGRSYSIDPNRIFTENGRGCGIPAEIRPDVEKFAGELLGVLFQDRAAYRESGLFVVAVHNNADIESKSRPARAGDLSAAAFVKVAGVSHGTFQDQAAGVYLSNAEDDPDNFVFLSTPEYIGYFADFGFNVVVQRPAISLTSNKCSVDDGSLSVYSAQAGIPYICLEADAANGEIRHRQMFEAVYGLVESKATVPFAHATAGN
jgi:hypothetical protein